MYKPLQKKNSSWTPTTAQKKSKSPSKLGHFSIQPKPNQKSSQSPEIGEYSRDSADRLAANVMRSLEAKDAQETETPTVQPQSESRISVADVVGQRMPTLTPHTLTPQVRMASEVSPENPIQRQCADCASPQQEQSTAAGKDIEQISSEAGAIQTKLTVGAPGDPYEQEADRVAAQVVSMSAPPDNSAPVQRLAQENNPIQRWSLAQSITPVVQRRLSEQVQTQGLVQRAFQAGGTEASEDLESRLNASKGGGSPLSEEVRTFMEPRFGSDFSGVRVHTGSEAVQMNPELLAHELTHVVQQNPVISTNRVQQDETQQQDEVDEFLSNPKVQPKYKEGEVEKESAQIYEFSGTEIVQRQEVPQNEESEEESISFRINIQGNQAVIGNPDELIIVSLMQVFGLDRESAQAKVIDEDWRWKDRNFSGATAEQVQSGFFNVNIPLSAYRSTTDNLSGEDVPRGEDGRLSGAEERVNNLNRLPEEERARINAETDRRFREQTNYNQQLDPNNPQDQPYIGLWNEIRDQVLLEQEQRSRINVLPARLRDFLFSEDAPQTLEPRDYGTVLRIAEKLSSLSDAELADYQSKVTAETTDWNRFEASIDRYSAEMVERRRNLEEREDLKTQLYGLEELYRKYKEYKSALSNAALSDAVNPGSSLGLHLNYIPELREELDTALEQHGFSSISEFETLIRNYETAFETETVAIALDLLAKYEHILYEEEKKYKDSAQVATLNQNLSRTQARENYQEADEYQRLAMLTAISSSRGGLSKAQIELQLEYHRKASEARNRAEAGVNIIAETHPLLQNQDFDREKLATADQSQVQSIMLDYIQERRQDIQETRANLADNPKLIYKLDKLLKESYQAQGIQPDSIYDLIIQDRIGTVEINEIIINLAIAVLAIALGLVSGGGGTVGVLAGVAGFGLGAYQVVEEFRQYEIKSAASGAELLSDDPSLGWVIVAVLGAGLDLAGAVAAIRAMKPALETFNATGDLAQFRRSLQGLSEVNQQLKANVLRAAEAELQYRQALRSLVSTGGRLRMVIVPGGEEFVKLVGVAYLLAKRGIIAFEQFLLELKAQRLIAELDEFAPDEWFRQLPVDEQQALKQAFRDGRRLQVQADELVAQGDPVIQAAVEQATEELSEDSIARINRLIEAMENKPNVPESFTQGEFFARGGTSQLYYMEENADLLIKPGGGRLPNEAKAMVEMEMIGIPTVYVRKTINNGQKNVLILQKIDGVGSKNIIGRSRDPINPPINTEVVTQKTIDDLEEIYQKLQQNKVNIGDFQFIVRRSDGAVFVNDPVSFTRGSGPKGDIRNIIDRFKKILRDRGSN